VGCDVLSNEGFSLEEKPVGWEGFGCLQFGEKGGRGACVA
jgi:hypothetical protein